MTVIELIEALGQLPDEAEVLVIDYDGVAESAVAEVDHRVIDGSVLLQGESHFA